jgi:predicted house-cleaning noncanonical NTP pyrophosphatase (MazG superfamily)
MKLVRNKIPSLHAAGQLTDRSGKADNRETFTFRKATAEEYGLLLRLKLAEEVGEILSAPTRDQMMDEIGDLIDVLNALRAVEPATDEDHMRRIAKRERLGEFGEGWVLIHG